LNEIGIMQGRLSPADAERPQAFPWRSWEDEFHRARECGFDALEWLFDADRYEQNPLWTDAGRKTIRRQIETTGVRVPSLCAHYFMVHPLFRVSPAERHRSVTVLNTLIGQAAEVGIRTILIPVLEDSAIRTDTEKAELLDSLRIPLSLAAHRGLRLGLETELPSSLFRALVQQCNHPALGIYYDTGNATARGFDIAADLRDLAPHLCGVHIKDRKRGGASVCLGLGDADFSAFFQVVADLPYTGPLMLETPRGDDPLGNANANLAFVKNCLASMADLNRHGR
jgi:L-ribulose-5-phosphate 3-epimerase